MPHTYPQQNFIKGLAFSLMAFFCLALINMLAKTGQAYASSGALIFWQSVVGLICLFPWFYQHGFQLVKTKRLPLVLFRAIVGAGGWYFAFAAIARISLTTATLMSYSAPLWMPVMGHFLFKEKVDRRVWLGVIVGFIGVILVLQPKSLHEFKDIGVIFSLISAILVALAFFSIRWLSSTEHPMTILFYYFVISIMAFAPSALPVPHYPLFVWGLLVALGITLFLSQWLITIAYRYASAVKLSPYVYAIVIFAAFGDWLVWHHTPNLLKVLGILLVIAGGVWSMEKESKPIRLDKAAPF